MEGRKGEGEKRRGEARRIGEEREGERRERREKTLPPLITILDRDISFVHYKVRNLYPPPGV